MSTTSTALNRAASWFGWSPLEPRHRARIDLQAAVERALADREPPHPVVAAALAFWRRGILEPGQKPVGPEARPQPEVIDQMIRGEAAGAWDWLKPYTKNGQTSWCGHFASACVGEKLSKVTRQKVLASTYRLRDYGPEYGVRRLAPSEARPGDLLVVKYAGGEPPGDHITVVIEVDHKAGLVHTVEGNARGRVIGGRLGVAEDCREGVIRRTRPLGRASRARCPVSGLRQTAGAFAAYRLPLALDGAL